MLLDTLFLFFYFISSQDKIICITKDLSLDSLKCSNKIEGIIPSSDLTSDISKLINATDTNIEIYLIGTNIEFKFKLNIFNNKNLTVQFDSDSNGTFDVSGINNINMQFLFPSIINIYPTVKFYGSALIDTKSSIKLEKIHLEADFPEIQLNNFTILDSYFSFSKFTVNSLTINDNKDTILIINDNTAVYSNQTFTFSDKKSISIYLSSNNQLIIDNQASSSNSIPSLLIQNAQSVTFKGNDFDQTNTIMILDCSIITTYVSYLPLSSLNFSSSSLSNFQLNINKEVTIKGSIELSSSNDLIISIINSTESRTPINIDYLSLENGKIQVLSSWIDLTINTFKFKSTSLPFVPCIGYGGSATLTANNIDLESQTKLSFDSISIKLEFTQDVTDEELSNLKKSDWNIITFKSFTNANAVSSFDQITFTPENIYGFGDSESARIIRINSIVSDDYIVTLTASSISTLPYLVCFIARGSCKKGGKTIKSLSELSTVVPADRKSVTLIIGKAYAEINLSGIQTTGAEFTIEYDHSTFPIISISMDDEFPNTKIDHLILNGISIGNSKGGDSFVQLNSREVTFIKCTNSSETKITFNENSVVNIDQSSFDQLAFYVNSFPQTNLITPIESASSFEISENQYIFTCQSNTISYSKEKLPKVAFQIELNSNTDYSIAYKTIAKNIDSVDLKFVSIPDQSINPKITVTFQELDSITNANHIGIDFGSFDSGNTVDFSTYEKANYFNFTGKNINIIPDNDDQKSNGKICVCKTKPCTNYCEDDYTQINYNELEQTIQEFTGKSLKIIIVGDQDGNSPILPIGLLNNKDVIIVGEGQNPKIQIDSSSELNNLNNTLEFSKITIAHSSGNNFVVCNLKLLNDTIVDPSFNSISLTVNDFECDISSLQFSSVLVQKSLILSGDATNSNSISKVSFAADSKFTFSLPKLITVTGSRLTFNNLEFDLTNVCPNFSLFEYVDELIIIANNGNIDAIGSDIDLLPTNQLKSVYFNGTWANKNPSKFIVFKNFSSDLLLDSENIPVSIEYASFNKIELLSENVGIAGIVTFTNGSFGDYQISAVNANSTSNLFIKEINISYESSGTANVDFETSNINLEIETLTLSSKFKIICFNMLIDLNHQNHVKILNTFDQTRSQALRYTVICTITENLNHPQMIDFIYNNHTLITANDENTIQLHNSITFDEKAPIGFNNDNFMLSNDCNKLTFYTVKSPIEDVIYLYYGNCTESCRGTKIENITSIDKIIPNNASLVVIVFYDSFEDSSLLDLDKPNISIKLLTLRSNSELRTIAVKFGKSVSNLEVESISMINDPNDLFSMETAKLSNGASFSSKANLDNLKSLIVDKESIFASKFTGFKNSFKIFLDLKQPNDASLSYTQTGMKITDSGSRVFNIDVSKLENVTLHVKSKESPKINLEKDVKQLKQVHSFIIDSSLIHIGSNWNSLKSETPLIIYSIAPQETDVSVITDSFPFEAWDLMYIYPIHFSDTLTPFSYSDELEVNGKNLTFDTFSISTSNSNDIKFDEIIMKGDSSITTVSDKSRKTLIIEEIKVKENSLAKLKNAQIHDEISLEPGSSLTDDFNLAEGFSEIELEWDLDQSPLFNPLNIQTVIPEKIEIVYKGASTEGREQLFNDFLSKGVILMRNIKSCSELIPKVHFKSESSNEFKDGESLSIKCQCINNNELQLISDKKEVPGTPPCPTTEVPYQNGTEPTVDFTSFNLAGESIQFTKDGYREDGKDYSGNDNKNDILLVNALSTKLTTSTTNEQPNNDFYLSPKAKNSQITIPNLNDYGQGEIGIHANSNNPTITIPKSKVPLKLFNNENSEINLILNGEKSTSISLNRLLINKGIIKFNIPNGITGLHFDKVEVYNTGNVQSLIGENKADTEIDILDMKSGSTVTMSNAKFSQTVKSAPHSKLIINGKSTFNENTNIQLTQTSLIEFGNSIVEGVCKEIKLIETGTSKESKHFNSESEVQLVCGSRFECFSWLSKYSGNSNYPTAKCINYTNSNEMCLVASSKSNQENNVNPHHKKKLSGGAIAGICIACVVVTAVIIGLVLYCLKRHHDNKILQYTNMDNAEFNDPSHL